MMKLKQAAMFGLDARIALAIFGALSVISGAALYSAIQESKVTSLISEMNEIGKAVEQYILDTGKELPVGTGIYLNAKELITSTVDDWGGPYLPYGPSTNTYQLDHPKYVEIGVLKGKKFGYSDGNTTHDQPCDATTCDIYVYINGVPHDIATAIDEKIDGVASIDSGRVYLAYGFTGGLSVFNTAIGLKIMPALNRP